MARSDRRRNHRINGSTPHASPFISPSARRHPLCLSPALHSALATQSDIQSQVAQQRTAICAGVRDEARPEVRREAWRDPRRVCCAMYCSWRNLRSSSSPLTPNQRPRPSSAFEPVEGEGVSGQVGADAAAKRLRRCWGSGQGEDVRERERERERRKEGQV